MRPIVYIVGAAAGFFTFAGLGLIARSFQLEGGITLAIGLLNLIVFVGIYKTGCTDPDIQK